MAQNGESVSKVASLWPRSEKNSKRQRRARTCFTAEALERLEKVFLYNPYPDINVRERLAAELGISESRIQVWYQNKRSRTRRRARKRCAKVALQNQENQQTQCSKSDVERRAPKYTAFTVDSILATPSDVTLCATENENTSNRQAIENTPISMTATDVLQQLYRTCALQLIAPFNVVFPTDI